METHINQQAKIVADAAFEATKDYPCFEAQDRLQAMLQHVVEQDISSDYQAAVIKACRVKAGLA